MKRHEYLALIFVILATLYVAANSDRDAAPSAAHQQRPILVEDSAGGLRGAPQYASGPVVSHPADRKVPHGGAPLPAVAVLRHTPAGALPDTSTSVSGTATWCAPTPRYCHGWGGSAHLGAMASFRYGDRPYLVTVRRGSAKTIVRVVSYCDCGSTLIDLSPAAFDDLAPLSRGRIRVTLTVGVALPATDTGGTP